MPSRPRNPIVGYHEYRADNVFGFGNADYTADGNQFYIGVEMEYECRGNHVDAAREIYRDMEDWAFMSGDGSLNGGFEIVTRPDSQESLEEKFNHLFSRRLNSNLGLVVNNHTGLHINISKSAFRTRLAQAYAIMICNNFQEMTQRVAGRTARGWCEQQRKSLSSSQNDLSGNIKHSAVHVKPSALEIRLFKATTHPNKFKQRLDFARLVIEYSNDCARRAVLPSEYGIKQFIVNNEEFASLRDLVEEDISSDEAAEYAIDTARHVSLRTRAREGMLSWEDSDVPDWANVLLESNSGTRVFAHSHRDGAPAWPTPHFGPPNDFFHIRSRTWSVVSYREQDQGSQSEDASTSSDAPLVRRRAGTLDWSDPDVPEWACELLANSEGERVFTDARRLIGWPSRINTTFNLAPNVWFTISYRPETETA